MRENLVGYLIIVGMLILIIAFNISLITALKNRPNNKSMRNYRSAFDVVKSPWKSEEDALEKLSNIVNELSPEDHGKSDEKNN